MKTAKTTTLKITTLMIAATLALSACTKKQVRSDDNNLPNSAGADENSGGDSDNGKALGLQTIHFGYDAFLLDAEAKSILGGNAAILKDKPSVKIQIEGHCDQRGGIQYNLALGEKRANAVKKFLMGKGIKQGRIAVISFGKEKPVDAGASEESYAKNRRANFVVTTK